MGTFTPLNFSPQSLSEPKGKFPNPRESPGLSPQANCTRLHIDNMPGSRSWISPTREASPHGVGDYPSFNHGSLPLTSGFMLVQPSDQSALRSQDHFTLVPETFSAHGWGFS
ncbi:hypothetical protein RRG08_005016 [Elysia crispata]|uniref:Uncharacterized protein n=1 Tax=Elysia crispata TaxID=231223 RepID=A0AAE1B2R2_9GAST|nr:hypothetical protein RRG08_005016 [Elysia crispata]